MTLKYPSQSLQDFITIQASDYVSSTGRGETGGITGNYVPGPPAGAAIVLGVHCVFACIATLYVQEQGE